MYVLLNKSINENIENIYDNIFENPTSNPHITEPIHKIPVEVREVDVIEDLGKNLRVYVGNNVYTACKKNCFTSEKKAFKACQEHNIKLIASMFQSIQCLHDNIDSLTKRVNSITKINNKLSDIYKSN